MNELELLRGQLETEMRHFSAVLCACSEVLQKPGRGSEEFLRAGLEYLAFAVERLQGDCDPGDPDPELTQALRSAQAESGAPSVSGTPPGSGTPPLSGAPPVSGAPAATHWQRFAALLERQLQTRQAAIQAARLRGATIAEWRAVARLDADSIVREREQYQLLRHRRPAYLTTELG